LNENHIEVSRQPIALRRYVRWRTGHLGKLHPLLAIFVWKAVRNFYVALALVVCRQAPQVPESHLKGERRGRARTPPPTTPGFRFQAGRKRTL
jgi:hypothetical protein